MNVNAPLAAPKAPAMSKGGIRARKADAEFKEANEKLADYTKWLLEKGVHVIQIIVEAIERAPVKTDMLNDLNAINKRGVSQIQMQRLKFDKNGRIKDAKEYRKAMLATTKRILAIFNAYGDQVTTLFPPMAVEVFQNFKSMKELVDRLPEDFEKLPECLSR